jgi:hypothetical protein
MNVCDKDKGTSSNRKQHVIYWNIEMYLLDQNPTSGEQNKIHTQQDNVLIA